MRFAPPPHLPSQLSSHHHPAPDRHRSPRSIFHQGRVAIYLFGAAVLMYLVITPGSI